MATAEERMKILRMIRDGKITAEEGAKLLAALSASRKSTPRTSARPSGKGHWFRVRVTDMITGKTKTSVNIPIGLVEWGLQIGAQFSPDVANLDKDSLMEMLKAGVEGKILDVVDEEDGEHIEIYIE